MKYAPLLALIGAIAGCATNHSPHVIEVGTPWNEVAAPMLDRHHALSTQCLSNSRMLFGWPPVYCSMLGGDRLLIINADEQGRFVESLSIESNVSQPKGLRGPRMVLDRVDLDDHEYQPEPRGPADSLFDE